MTPSRLIELCDSTILCGAVGIYFAALVGLMLIDLGWLQ